MSNEWLLSGLWVSYIRRHAAAVSLLTGLGLLHSCCSLLLPLFVGEFLLLQFNQSSSRQTIWHWLGLGHTSNIQHFLLLFSALVAFRIALEIAEGWLKNTLGFQFAQSLSCQRALALRQLETVRKKDLNSLHQENNTLKQWMQKGILDVPKHVGYFILLLILLHQLHATLFYVTAIVLAVISVVAVIMAWAQQPAFLQKRRMQVKFNNALHNMATKNCEPITFHYRQPLLIAVSKYQCWQAIQKSLRQHTLYMVILMLMIFMVYGPVSNTYDSGTFIVFWLVLLTGVSPIRGLLELPAIWSKARIASSKFLHTKKDGLQPILPEVVTL